MAEPKAPRVKFRMMRMPVEREEYKPEPREPVTGRDGVTRPGGHLTGLPVNRTGPDEDMGVTWHPWPPS